MSSFIKLSDAASIAIHAMIYMAARDVNPCATPEMARSLGVSEAHLSKVLQHLSRHGYIKSKRGPDGGYALAKPARDINLYQIFICVEGPLCDNPCLLKRTNCDVKCCAIKEHIIRTNEEYKLFLEGQRLSAFASPGDSNEVDNG